MSITGMGMRITDAYDWESAISDKLLHKYNGLEKHDGRYAFGFYAGYSGNEVMEMNLHIMTLVEQINAPKDLFRIFTRVIPFDDCYTSHMFDGVFSYSGITYNTSSGMHDGFSMRIHSR